MDELIQTRLNGKLRTNDILFYREQSDKDLGANITLDYNFNSRNNISYSADAGYTDIYVDANFKYDETIIIPTTKYERGQYFIRIKVDGRIINKKAIKR